MAQVYGFECLTCQHRTETYVDRCPSCHGVMSAVYESPDLRASEREIHGMFGGIRSRQRNAQGFRPVVFHTTKDGHISWPASPDAPVRPGYERQEARTIRELEKVEGRMNRQELDKAEQYQHREEMRHAWVRSQHRPEFLKRAQRMSAGGRKFAEVAMQMNDARTIPVNQPNVHLEILHFDQGNREAHRDRETNWKARRY